MINIRSSGKASLSFGYEKIEPADRMSSPRLQREERNGEGMSSLPQASHNAWHNI